MRDSMAWVKKFIRNHWVALFMLAVLATIFTAGFILISGLEKLAFSMIYWPFFGLFMALGLYLFWVDYDDFRTNRVIGNTPTSKIRSIAMGLVEINGTVVPAENGLFLSPITKNKCVCCQYSVTRAKDGRVVLSGDTRQNFFLQDDTGAVLVDSKNAELRLKPSYFFQSDSIPENIKQMLKANRIPEKNFLGINEEWIIVESAISAGDELYVLGTADDNPYVPEAQSIKGVEDVIIHKGDKKTTFIISNLKEKGLEVSKLTIPQLLVTFKEMAIGIVLIVFSMLMLILSLGTLGF